MNRTSLAATAVFGLALAGVVLLSRPTLSAPLALAADSGAADSGSASSQKPASAEGKSTEDRANFFESQVLPILEAHCFSCHGAEKKIKGGLRLTTRENVLKGGESGPAVDLEKLADSTLLKVLVAGDGWSQMPPKGRLPQAQIDVLTKWVNLGVPFSEKKAVATHHGPPPVDEKARQWWAFRPVTRPAIPTVKDSSWVRSPMDAFVLAKLEAAGYRPAPVAEKATLLRRATYAVTGLPPTPAELDAFLRNPAPDAYEQAVDRLLASRHFGEHWGRHWLDLVRYAESNSFERDGTKPFVWRYRDYVIAAFNADKPFDRFIREQIAGDELPDGGTEGLVATGYYRLGTWDDEPADPLLAMYDELDDILATTGQTFLGLTVNCARCHDHKIDPFPQADYYRMLSFFAGLNRYGIRNHDSVVRWSVRGIATPAELERGKPILAAHQAKIDDLTRQMATFEDKLRPHLRGGEIDDFKFEQNRRAVYKRHVGKGVTAADYDAYKKLVEQRDRLRGSPPAIGSQALCVTETDRVRETFVLVRGNHKSPGARVEPGFPSVLGPADAKPPTLPAAGRAPLTGEPTSGRRTVLANWLADPANPLTARVWANRILQYTLGRGIVRSTSNFGYMGTPPTHPELLDFLADEFVRGGMRTKPVVRAILLSATFRMSGRPAAETLAAGAANKDPENDLLWRFPLRRLSAEEVRDSILAISGNLNLAKTDGPSVFPLIPREVLAGQSRPGENWGRSSPAEQASRSVYVHIKRSLGVPLLVAFDSPDPDSPCPVRFVTTQPGQALGLINSEFAWQQAGVMADSVAKAVGSSPTERVRTVLLRATQRPPSDAEIARGVRFLAKTAEADKLSPEQALVRFCLLAVNLNEFVYVD